MSTPALRVVPPLPTPSRPRRGAVAWTTPVQLWGLMGAVVLTFFGLRPRLGEYR